MPSKILALDLGGTRLKSGVVDTATLTVMQRDVRDVPDNSLKGALDAVRSVASTSDSSAIALCVPGLVDEHGIVTALPGKFEGIVGFNLPDFLSTEFGLPATVVNDAVAYGVGEATAGAARGSRSAVIVTIGTGVGVCVVHDSKPVAPGVHGGGILGGQIPISEATTGPVDTNGRPDTIEAFCRAQRIVELAGIAYGSVPEVYNGHSAGESDAVRAIDTYRTHLARALAALAHAHAPTTIVLGGGPMVDGNPVLPGLQEAVRSHLWPGYDASVVLASLGDDAALIGLAHLAGNR